MTWQFDRLSADGSSLIDQMTAEAQAARDAFGFNEWEMDGRKGILREDVWEVVERADKRFGVVEDRAKWARLKKRMGG